MTENPYADDPRMHAPAGPTGADDKSVAPGPGPSSPGDIDSVDQAAQEAGDQAEAFAGVRADTAEPLQRDDTDALSEPGTGSLDDDATS